MAQDEVVIKYRIDTSEFGKVGAAVTDVSKKVDDLKVKAQAAFASGQLDAATNKLIQQGDVMGALIERYGSATAALKGLEKEMQTMAALGQRNTKEFKELARVTSELKDSVQDTRGEIKKMASDTRVFDTMVQGARGVAAAFSVATGVAAAFGDENKDLQKTLLKVQGAMAALQGVQELANLATEKGGIATKAYGVALELVDKISKATGLSMAASWALATAGISVVITGIVFLISKLNDATNATDELTEAEQRRKKEIEERSDTEAIANTKQSNDLKKLEVQYKRALLDAKDRTEELQIEAQYRRDIANALYTEQVGLENLLTQVDKNINNGFEYNKINEKILDTQLKYIEAMSKVKDAEKELADIRSKLPQKQSAIDNVTINRTVNQLETKGTGADLNKMANQDAELIRFAQQKSLSDKEKYDQTKLQLEADYWNKSFELAQKGLATINDLIVGQANSQLADLNAKRESDLKRAGDNAKRKEMIERKYAVESAKIARKVAIAEKITALFNIGIELAQAINKINLQAAILRANPATAALAGLAQSQIGFAIATAGLSTIAVAAKPLPTIPQFEKGGRVIAGGRKDDGMLFGRSHRDGGILIEAQGGEYIWDIPTVKKHGDVIKAAHENRLEQHVFHKYVVPQMQKGRAAQGQNESYDDFMLRTTVKNSADRSAEKIVNGIVKGLKKDSYLISRYG